MLYEGVSCNCWRHWTPPQCLILGRVFNRALNLGSPPASRFSSFRGGSIRWGVHLFDHYPFSPRMTRRRLAALLAVALAPAEPETNTSSIFPQGRSRGGALSTVRFCPHMEAGDIQTLLMLPFMVSQCACFDDEEDEETIATAASNAKAHHHHKPWEPSCCRCAALAGEGRTGLRLRRSSFFPKERDRCAFSARMARHQYHCRQCPAVYGWAREMNCVSLYCESNIQLHGTHSKTIYSDPTDPDWLRVIDPASWDAEASKELKRVTWCEDSKCATTSNWYKLV